MSFLDHENDLVNPLGSATDNDVFNTISLSKFIEK